MNSSYAERARYASRSANCLARRFVVVLTDVLAALLVQPESAHAQRARENAVAEASDAFGMAVGREEIGLYSTTSARGFSPSQAGNLRIDGLYFDQVVKPAGRIVRGSTVHVGISAQGYAFPAPTGVVDFHLRNPASESAAGGALVGLASYDQAYGEFDFKLPVVQDTLSVGGGIGYSRNSSFRIAEVTDEWTAGAIAQWRPMPALTITPFWGITDHREQGERQHVFIGASGWPRYRGVDLMPQPWADYVVTSQNMGSTLRYAPGGGWRLEAGVFRSVSQTGFNMDPFLLNTNSEGEGDYVISAAPPRVNESVSGEVRLSRAIDAGRFRNTLHLAFKGRDRTGESGGADTRAIGPGTTRWVPQIERPLFVPQAKTVIEARQLTPGVAYEGLWKDVGQLSLGVQKSFYERTNRSPGEPVVSSESQPWLYNAAAAGFVTPDLLVYASFTRGFEEIGNAPLIAVNRDEAVPAELTEQVDAGIRYQLLKELQLVAGVFEIRKPYFDLDQENVFRRIGDTRNRGIELSLAGALTDTLTVVAGLILIDPEVKVASGAGSSGRRVAIGPVPGLLRVNLQYRLAGVEGMTLDAKVERNSGRYARPDILRLPAVTTVDIGVRYDTMFMGRNVAVRLQGMNLTDQFGLLPAASGQLTPFDSRRFEFSLAFDM